MLHPIDQWKSEIKIDEFGVVKEGCDLFVERLCDYINMPDSETVFETLRNMDKSRPRVLSRIERFECAKADAGFRARIYRKLKKYANKYPKKGVTGTWEGPLQPTLMFAREYLDRAFVIGFFNRTEGNFLVDFLEEQTDIALKIYKDLLLSIDYSEHTLPLGELTVGLCVAYDWAYDYLSQEKKDEIRQAVKEKAIEAVKMYGPPYQHYMTQVNNWNAVVSDSFIVAAITMYGEDDDNELWEKLLNGAVRSVTLPISEFAPNGGFPEGPGYWSYQMQYIMYGISTLDSALKTDFNIGKLPGFSKTALVPVYQHGNPGNDFAGFNFADCEYGPPVVAWLYWLAHKFEFLELFSYADAVYPDGVDYDSWVGAHYDIPALLWRRDTASSMWKTLPKSYCFEGRQQVMSIRENFEKDGVYFAFKGGYNHLPHCNLDIGTFVYDWNGIRWFCDLGKECYALPELWDFYGGRWRYYTQKAEGHNTIVVNPSEEPDQNIFGFATVEKKNDSTGVVDITDAYPDLVRGEREFSLVGATAIIKDELITNDTSDIYWFMHTEAEVKITAANRALLFKDGSAILVEFELPQGAELFVMEAKPLVLPVLDGTKDLSHIRKLCVKTTAKGAVKLVTKIIPQP